MGTLNWDEYAVTWARLHGGFDPRRATPAVRDWLRLAYRLARFLGRLRVTPSVVTLLGLLLCLCVPLVAVRSSAWLVVGGLLVLLAAMADSVDGALAVISGRTSRLGYVYDALADRIGEAAWLTAFWLVGAPGLLVVVGGAVSWLHEYARARSVSAGMREIGRVTVGERPLRVVVVAAGLPLAGMAGLVQPALAAGTITVFAAIWVLLGLYGLGQLLPAIRRALS